MVVADSTAIINRAAAALVPETAKVMHSSTQSRIWGTERIMPAHLPEAETRDLD